MCGVHVLPPGLCVWCACVTARPMCMVCMCYRQAYVCGVHVLPPGLCVWCHCVTARPMFECAFNSESKLIFMFHGWEGTVNCVKMLCDIDDCIIRYKV